MRRLAVSIVMLSLAQTASAQAPREQPPDEGKRSPPAGIIAAVPGEGRPFAIRHMACDEVRFITPHAPGADGITWGPESVVVVKNEAGTTGIRFFVNRETGETVGVQTWRELAGRTVTSIPAAARVDWVNCQDADPMGGIIVEWVDVRSLMPSPEEPDERGTPETPR